MRIFQDYSDGDSFDKGGFAFRRLVPVAVAKFSEDTQLMITILMPSNHLLNTVRFVQEVDLGPLQGTFWVAQEAVFFCMEESESGMRIMTPDRSIINMYFGGGDDGYWGGKTTSFSSNVAFSGYHTGLYWFGRCPKNESLIYRIQVVNSTHNKVSFDGNNGIACFATIGVDKQTPDERLRSGINVGYSSRVVAATSQASLPARTVDYGDCFGINPYFWWKNGPFTVQSELVATHVKYGRTLNDNIPLYTLKSPDANPWGFYALLAYKFNINPLGEFEPLIRYSYLDTDRRGVCESGVLYEALNKDGLYNKVQSIFGGFNWYLLGQSLKYQLGIEYAMFRDSPSGATSKKSDVLLFTLQMQLVL